MTTKTLADDLRRSIRDIPDFPKPGIMFKDIAPVLQDGELFAQVVDAFAARLADRKITHVVGIEARGFVFSAALAYKLGVGLIPARKKGKLPYKTIARSYQLEYGQATLEIHEDALRTGDRVVVVDDLLATGGTAAATAELVEQTGATLDSILFVVELSFLKGRPALKDRNVVSLLTY